MSRNFDDLRATADSIAADAERLASVEREKTRRPADGPAVERLSRQARVLSDRIGAKVTVEQDLVVRPGDGPRAVR
jgi:hypothetical protein